jgi:TetR/AcrR family transcriptional regulator, transcriptional repressor for nem operon
MRSTRIEISRPLHRLFRTLHGPDRSAMRYNDSAKERLLAAAIELVWNHSYGSVTVDALCKQADVRKGSFYHFFASKAELVVAALDCSHQQRRPDMDRIFSPLQPPLERIKAYCEYVCERQAEIRRRTGRVLGCLLTSLGCEVSHEEPNVRGKVQELLDRQCRYFESALRDAESEGLLAIDDIPAAARALLALVEGVLSQARIENDIERVRGLWESARQLLGLPGAAARAAGARERRAAVVGVNG